MVGLPRDFLAESILKRFHKEVGKIENDTRELETATGNVSNRILLRGNRPLVESVRELARGASATELDADFYYCTTGVKVVARLAEVVTQ